MKREGRITITWQAMSQAIIDGFASEDQSRRDEARLLVLALSHFFDENASSPAASGGEVLYADEITEKAIALSRPDWARGATDEEVKA